MIEARLKALPDALFAHRVFRSVLFFFGRQSRATIPKWAQASRLVSTFQIEFQYAMVNFDPTGEQSTDAGQFQVQICRQVQVQI